MSTRDLSVVIGFRDWGIDRLRRSVSSLEGAVGALDAEVIISEYGSADPSLSQEVARRAGVRWVHTPGDPVWSRSRALNAGFAVADGDLLVSTDADMIFAPESLAAVHAEAMAGDPSAVFLQCRDLPSEIPDSMFDEIDTIDWDLLERRSRLRPRWGMGGMMAIDRDAFTRLRGFDERLHTYGREDIDVATRALRAGWRMQWAQDPRARMFHMWHPPATSTVQSTETGRRAITRNRQIVDADRTVSRNLDAVVRPLAGGDPLVSIVVLPGEERDGLHRTVATALSQTVHDLEVVLGERPGTASELGLEGPRLSRHNVPDDQAAALVDLVGRCRGVYVAIVRGGELLPLDRTETLLRALVEGSTGAFGRTAAVHHDGEVCAEAPRPSMSTLLVDRRLLRVLVEHHGRQLVDGAPLEGLVRRMGLVMAALEAPVLLELPGPTAATCSTPSPVQDVDAAALRMLLPAGHPGHRRASAHLPRLVPGSDIPMVDGSLSYGGITHGSAPLQSELRVEDPSYADLARLALRGQGLTLVDAAAGPHAPAPGWVEQISRHALAHGASLPLAVHREEHREASAETYGVASLGESLSLRVTSPGSEQMARLARGDDETWLLIGATIEEVWT